MLSPAEAESAISANVRPLPSEDRPLERLAGAVLHEAVHATRDQPPFDRVTMDGVAFAASAHRAGTRNFRIAATQAAGAPPVGLEDPNDCIEVMTGAILPKGCDCVVPIEKITVREGYAHVPDEVAPVSGANVHARGIDCRAGSLLLAPGTLLGPAEIAVIASSGRARVKVSREPRIVVITTGNELVEPGEPVAQWQIYRSNAYAVLAALKNRGFERLTHDHLADDVEALRTALSRHLDEQDVLIMSGGVSMGRYDYVPQVLDELGVRTIFHKISQRPGKPMWFGVHPNGTAVYALPGNPVSASVCLARYVYRGLDAARGRTPPEPQIVALSEDFEVKPALTYFLPVALAADRGTFSAQPRPTQGSGDFTSLLRTDGFVELPPGPRVVTRSTPVNFYPW